MLTGGVLGRGRVRGRTQRSFLVYLSLMVKCFLVLISSLAGSGVFVLVSSHGRVDDPSNNKIIVIIIK